MTEARGGWRTMVRMPGAILSALSWTLFMLATDTLPRFGLTSLASGLCHVAARFNAEVALLQLAYVRSHGGDLEGALSFLAETIPGDEGPFFRELHSALMCQEHRQNNRAAAFFEAALRAPEPVGVSAEWRSQMERHILKLRELGDGIAAG